MSRSPLTSAGTANEVRQVGQFVSRPILSATLQSSQSPQYRQPHSKHCPHASWSQAWSSSFLRQIGHGCAASSSALPTRGGADAGAAAASSGFGGAGLQWLLWLPPRASQGCFRHRRQQNPHRATPCTPLQHALVDRVLAGHRAAGVGAGEVCWASSGFGGAGLQWPLWLPPHASQ